jgi:hypothetical protein
MRRHKIGKLLVDDQIGGVLPHIRAEIEDDAGGSVFDGLHGLPGTCWV